MFIGSILPSKLTLNLDPKLREKLLKESRQPFQGVRRVIWIALSGSAGVGLLIMGMRFISGENVLINDFVIQIGALLLFLTLLIVDKSRLDSEEK